MLYRYLKELDGICASHTSATGMGTDWRDNDPDVEPIVEIYQGDRMSYEYEGAPRAGYDPKGDKKPANIGGWEPKGFINHALDKGYKLGFQSSSDHWSTHISYCIVLAEKHDRAGILDAFKQAPLLRRHRQHHPRRAQRRAPHGRRVQGGRGAEAGRPRDRHGRPGGGGRCCSDSKVVDVLKADGKEYKATWTDPKPAAGKHYYYVRVTQKDKRAGVGFADVDRLGAVTAVGGRGPDRVQCRKTD